MAAVTVSELVDTLRRLALLDASQLEELAHRPVTSWEDSKALARALLQRDWLTAYQVNQLLQGRGDKLVLGGYVLLERLGEGGMGQVFKARHRTLGRVVALKVIRPERLTNAAAVKRFRREVQAVAQLSHPNIVLAFDADQAGEAHFLVMEYVEGTDLAQRVKQLGPLSVADACDAVRQAAQGLEHAHVRGMVHRDVKPHNLLREQRDGRVKVLDLGMALFRPAENADGSLSTMTHQGTIMGSLDYLAPEQAEDAHRADIRADLYSLGCTFYYLLTGQAPFPRGSALQKILSHRIHPPPPLEGFRPDVPTETAAVVYKLLAKKPEDRFQTPTELLQELANVGTLPAIPSPLPRPCVGDPPGPEGGPLPTVASGVLASTTRPPRRQADQRRWLLLNAGGFAILLLALSLLAFLLTRPTGQPKASPLAREMPAPPTPTDHSGPQLPTGFVQLFNGRDLTGWEVKAGLADDWVVSDGVLVCQGTNKGWLGTRAMFRDFILRLEWRAPADGNSGVFFRTGAQPGPALEADTTPRQPTTSATSQKGGDLWLYPLGNWHRLPTSLVAVRGPNEWNTYEITCRGDRVTVVLNGVAVQDLDAAREPRLARLIGAGPIGLQNVGKRAEFRNIFLQDLDHLSAP